MIMTHPPIKKGTQPHGGGLMWMKTDFYRWIQGMYWSGHGLPYDAELAPLSVPGGQNFQIYLEIEESINLLRSIGQDTVLKQSNYLRSCFQKGLNDILDPKEIDYTFLNDEESSAVISIAFPKFNPYDL
jgi:hypothetical protein